MKPKDRRIRVLVADDSATALASICNYLEFEGLFDIMGTARDGRHLVEQARRSCPDLVLTDLRMPRMSGLDAAAELRRLFPSLRILIVTQLGGLSLKDECLRHGADGVVDKSRMPEGLMEEIRRLFPGSSTQK